MQIILENVCLTYAASTSLEQKALENVNMTISDGEFVGLMGHTGCGKSTILQLITGLIKPSSGRVLLDGEDINSKSFPRSKLRKDIGIVFQYPESQLFETTVEKDIAFGLKNQQLSSTEIKERTSSSLKLMGFDYEKVKDKSPMGLSGGEKRKIAIAGILATKPKCLLLDEPIAGLDPRCRKDFLELLKSLNENGTTIVMVSHNADCIAEYTKRLIVLNEGKILKDGETCEVFSDYEDLECLSIGVSQSQRIACMLSKEGLGIPTTTIKYSELLSSILTKLREDEKA